MKTILVVDDMAVFREPIAMALRTKGFKVVCAATGEEALTLMDRQIPDLVLLDIAMPGLDGLAVVQRMKSQSRWATVPVILLTAVAEKNYILQAAKLGLRDYMLKSKFSLAELYDRVARKLAAPNAETTSPSPRTETGTTPTLPAQASPRIGSQPFTVAPSTTGTSPDRGAPYLPATDAPPPSLEALKSLSPILGRAEVTEHPPFPTRTFRSANSGSPYWARIASKLCLRRPSRWSRIQ